MGETEELPDHLSKEDAAHFPNLEQDSYEITSPRDPTYNCIAYAAEDDSRWWESSEFPSPGYYWPDGAEHGERPDALKSCFEAIGYEVCDDGEPESGYTKVALYASPDGDWSHAARQIEGGEWTSKLGQNVDIRHRTPECVEGPVYGDTVMFMRRPDSGDNKRETHSQEEVQP